MNYIKRDIMESLRNEMLLNNHLENRRGNNRCEAVERFIKKASSVKFLYELRGRFNWL